MPASSACLDTSALIELLNQSSGRHRATLAEFNRYKVSGMVFITDVVFAETSANFTSAADLRIALDRLGIAQLSANDDALYLAGQTYKAYRQSRGHGKKDGVLPDFMIGAVAQTSGVALITFNEKDFVGRFVELEIVTPMSGNGTGTM